MNKINSLQEALFKSRDEINQLQQKAQQGTILRSKIKSVLLDNMKAEQTMRAMESQIDQLQAENTLLKSMHAPKKGPTNGQVLEFSRQIEGLQEALQESQVNEKRIMRKYNECIRKLGIMESHINGLSENGDYDGADTIVPGLSDTLSSAIQDLTLEHGKIKSRFMSTPMQSIECRDKHQRSQSSGQKSTESAKLIKSPSSDTILTEINQEDFLQHSYSKSDTINQESFEVSKFMKLVNQLLQKVKETDVLFINRILKQSFDVVYITDCSNALLLSLDDEILVLDSFGEVGICFGDIIKEIVKLRLDMNKFYTMYYEKMEMQSRSESNDIEFLPKDNSNHNERWNNPIQWMKRMFY